MRDSFVLGFRCKISGVGKGVGFRFQCSGVRTKRGFGCRVSGVRRNAVATKNYLDVEDLEVYKKLCQLHIEVCDLTRA